MEKIVRWYGAAETPVSVILTLLPAIVGFMLGIPEVGLLISLAFLGLVIILLDRQNHTGQVDYHS